MDSFHFVYINRNGGTCYLSCDHGLVIENITEGSVGSYSGPGVLTWRAYCLWIFTVSSHINDPWTVPPTITFGMEDMAVECERVCLLFVCGTFQCKIWAVPAIYFKTLP